MANITIAIDDDLLRRARIKAVTEGTSVNEVCRQGIEQYADSTVPTRYEDIRRELRELSRGYTPDPDGEPLWPGRDALHERGASSDASPIAPAPTKTSGR